LGPESVTVYQTEIPFNTKLHADLEAGSLSAPAVSWEVKRERLDYGFRKLEEAGYSVVSAYAAVKDPERHLFHYQHDLWHGCDMLGLGVASFGYLGGVHYQNEVTLHEYVTAVKDGILPLKRAYVLNDRERMIREFILQLKLGRVEAEPFHEKFGVAIHDVFLDALSDMERRGLLSVDDSTVVLSREGLLRIDRLLPEFYDSQCRNLRYT
jgi:oxygen-independent coproporphyrinogen-3 oxidase